MRGVCTNASLLWKGPQAIFSGFYHGPKRAFIELNWPEPARYCQKVRKSPALGGIQCAGELPPLKSPGEEL
jgi:hypothetical protein